MNSNDLYNNLRDQLETAMDGVESLNSEARAHLKQAASNLFDKLDIVVEKSSMLKPPFSSDQER